MEAPCGYVSLPRHKVMELCRTAKADLMELRERIVQRQIDEYRENYNNSWRRLVPWFKKLVTDEEVCDHSANSGLGWRFVGSSYVGEKIFDEIEYFEATTTDTVLMSVEAHYRISQCINK